MTPPHLPVLLYHSVDDEVDPRFAEWALTPERFARHMEALADRGFRTLTMREVAEGGFCAGEDVPEGTVVITFDDGFADFYTGAWPALRSHGLTATVFVTTGYVGAHSVWLEGHGEGGRRMMSWDQLREISAAGIECGAHGHTHAQLDTVGPQRVRYEVEQSRDALERAVGEVSSFAYPHGYHSRRARREVRRAGFSCACQVRDGLATPSDDPYAITRAVIRRSTSMDELLGIASGEGRAPRPRPVRRAAWRAVRRAGAEPLAERLRRSERPEASG